MTQTSGLTLYTALLFLLAGWVMAVCADFSIAALWLGPALALLVRVPSQVMNRTGPSEPLDPSNRIGPFAGISVAVILAMAFLVWLTVP